MSFYLMINELTQKINKEVNDITEETGLTGEDAVVEHLKRSKVDKDLVQFWEVFEAKQMMDDLDMAEKFVKSIMSRDGE